MFFPQRLENDVRWQVASRLERSGNLTVHSLSHNWNNPSKLHSLQCPNSWVNRFAGVQCTRQVLTAETVQIPRRNPEFCSSSLLKTLFSATFRDLSSYIFLAKFSSIEQGCTNYHDIRYLKNDNGKLSDKQQAALIYKIYSYFILGNGCSD